MTVAEIIILIVGAILFTVSFFIPDKDGEQSGGGMSKAAEERVVKELVEKEIEKYKLTLEEATEESINDKKDMMERYMDRLTNEKMIAVNEYSDTVLAQIKKDHEEAVFLYDMIDSKHNQVKSTAAEINQIEKSVKQLKADADNMVAGFAAPTHSEPTPLASVATEPIRAEEKKEEIKTPVFEPIAPEVVELTGQQKKAASKPAKAKPARKAAAPKKTKDAQKDISVIPVDVPATAAEPEKVNEGSSTVELMFDSDSNATNNNDRILALHKSGKSNMAIAKELGLGIGEVKLVIDLFEGI